MIFWLIIAIGGCGPERRNNIKKLILNFLFFILVQVTDPQVAGKKTLSHDGKKESIPTLNATFLNSLYLLFINLRSHFSIS
jgi:hypothetical protein